MRTQFTNELVALTDELTQMCRLTQDAAERVTDALVEADLTAAYEVFALDERLQAMYAACEERTVVLLALQAPVARDLRHVVTAIQIAGELSRIGWLTSRVADQVYKSSPDPVAPEPIVALLAEMGRRAAHATAHALRSVAAGQQPPEEAPDPPAETMEELNRQLHAALSTPAWTGSTDTAIELALLGHHLERCVDHTARIERLIRFLDTGVPPTAQPIEEERD